MTHHHRAHARAHGSVAQGHTHGHDDASHHGHSHGLVDRSIIRSRAGLRAVALSLAILGTTALARSSGS